MKLVEAMSIGPMRSARVVCAADHLDREISWVQVVDHPDMDGWVKEGHLLLTTGCNWPKDELAGMAMIERLAAKGISGVVLAVPHFLDQFPASAAEAAERVHLPLLEIPWEVPFSEVTLSIHRDLVDQQGRALARSEQIHRELTEAAVSGHSLRDVAQVLGEVLQRRVWILGGDGAELGAHAQASEGADGAGNEELPRIYRAVKAAKALGRIDAAAHPIRLRLTLAVEKTEVSVVAYAARVRGERVGYVLVRDDNATLSPLDLRAIEHAGTVAALQISHQRELSEQEARLGYALVASLIEGHFEATPQMIERARLAGWSEVAYYRLCTVLLDEPNPLSRAGFIKREELALKCFRSLEQQLASPLMSLSANQVHLLIPGEIDVDKWWAAIRPGRVAMGVSQTHIGVEGMAKAGRETAELMPHLKPGKVHHFEEMLFPRVLMGDADARRTFLDRMLGRLDEGKRGQHLLDTALALTQEGFHLQRSADRLGVHISTLRYRLERLSEHTALDLESVEGRFQLQMAARLYQMEL